MAKSHKGSKRGPKKGSKKGSRKGSKKSRKGSKKGSRKGSKKSKRCPPGTRKSYKKLASGKLSKTALCLPFGRKTTTAAKAGSKYEREEGEPGAYDDTLDFNLPALGFRVKRRGSRRGSRKTHRRRHSRKY